MPGKSAPSMRSQLSHAKSAISGLSAFPNIVQRSSATAKRAALGLDNQSPSYYKDHKNDELEYYMDSEFAAHLWTYSKEEPFMSRVITKACQDTVVPFDVRLVPKMQLQTVDAAEVRIPTILNAPVFENELKVLLQNVLSSLLAVGYAVVAIPSNLTKHYLGDLALASMDGERTTLHVPRPSEDKTSLPCLFLQPCDGDISVYLCEHTHSREYRFSPKSKHAMFLQARGYRFEVYLPCSGLLGTEPLAPNYTTGNRGFQSNPALLYPQYVKYVLSEGIHNKVTVARSKNIISEQAMVNADPEVNRTIRGIIASVSAHSGHSGETITSGGGALPREALPYVMDVIMRSASDRKTVGMTNMENCEDPSASESIGFDRPIPGEPVNSQTKTMQSVAFDFLKKTEWSSFLSYATSKDAVNSDMIQRPPGVAVTQIQRAEYVGVPPQTLLESYEDRVLASFGMSRLVFGIAGGRSTTTVGSTSAFKGKNAQEVAVGLEEKGYHSQIAKYQTELCTFVSWLYRTSMSVFDTIGLQELFEREAKAAQQSHDKIVELLQEYEILVEELDPSKADEIDDDADDRSTDKDAEARKEEILNNKQSAPSFMFKKKELRELMQKRLSLSFSEYAKISQWLFYLALCVHGTATVEVVFVKNKNYKDQIVHGVGNNEIDQ